MGRRRTGLISFVVSVWIVVALRQRPADAHGVFEQNGWRWFPDTTAQIPAADALAAESVVVTHVAPTGERLRLRVAVVGDGIAHTTPYPWTIEMTTDDAESSGWVLVTTTTDKFQLFDGSGTDGIVLSRGLVSTATIDGIWVESATNPAVNVLPGDGAPAECDYALQSSNAVVGETYSFRAIVKGHTGIGLGYPKLIIATTEHCNTFNFLRHRAGEGTYATPVPNLNASYQTLLLASGRLDRADTLTGGDTLYALSRTSGAVRWSLAQSGRVRGIRRVWSTPDNGYRVYAVVDGCMLSAMVDKNGSFTSVSGWATNPKPFGSSSAFPISDPMIVSETNHLGGSSYYLYIIATTYKSASNSLWKIQADDGQLDSDSGDWPFGPADAGASTEGWSTTAGLNWQGSVFWMTGRGDGVSYRVDHSPVATKTFETGAADINLPPHIASGAAASTLYLSPADTFVWKIRSDTMGTPVAQNSWDGGSASSNRSSTMVSTNTCSPFGQIGSLSSDIFAGVNDRVYTLQGTDGDIIWNPGGIQVSGGPVTGMAKRGAFLYFGTDTGWMYKMSATDGGVPTGWPWGAPGSPKVIGCAIDNSARAVFFTTDDGRLYSFDL